MMATAFAADDQGSGFDPGPTAQVRKLIIDDHPGPNGLPHDTRKWLKAAQAELGELLEIAEGGASMAAEEYGFIIDISVQYHAQSLGTQRRI